MPEIRTKVRQLRLELQNKKGELVSIQDVSDRIDIGRERLNRIELGQFKSLSKEEMLKLCQFFSVELERPVGIEDILEYDTNKSPATILQDCQPMAV